MLALQWSELLPDPTGSDNGKEYIELFGAEDLSDCTLADEKSTDTLQLLRRGTGTILILENESLVLDAAQKNDATVYVIGSAIGNGLGNIADNIAIVVIAKIRARKPVLVGVNSGCGVHRHAADGLRDRSPISVTVIAKGL